jgi:hypothetical protein
LTNGKKKTFTRQRKEQKTAGTEGFPGQAEGGGRPIQGQGQGNG